MTRFARPRRTSVRIEALESRLFLSSTILTGNTADAQVLSTGTIGSATGTTVRVGDNGTNASETNWVIPFQLPTLPAGATISSVTANFNLESLANPTSISGPLDLYGLGRRSAATVLVGDYYLGSYNGDTTDATAIQSAVATNITPIGSVGLNGNGISALTSYINSQYAGGAGAGQYVFLRLNAQVAQLTSRYWVFSTANSATTGNRPTITITYDVAPIAPSNLLAATTGSSTVQLNWSDNSNNETGFTIERSTNGTSWSNAGTVGADVTTFTDTGRSADTKYYYRVYASNGSNNSSHSNTVTTTTLPVFTTTRWVDVNYTGATANGAYATPYKTIANAMTAAVSGDGIVLRGGTYREQVTMKAGVTLMGTPDERAIVSGFASIGGWTLLSGSTYTTILNYKPSNLFVNYQPMELSREPDSSWWTAPTVTAGTGTHTISDPTHLVGIPSLVGGTVQVHIDASNSWTTRTITAHDTVNGTITFSTVTSLANNDYYIVKNKTDLLDRAGEWAVADNGNGTYTMFFRPIDVSDLNATQAQKLATQQVKAASNTTIRNLEITGNTGFGVYITGGATNVVVRDNVVHHNGSAGIQARSASNVTIQRNSVIGNDFGIGVTETNVGLIDSNDVGFAYNDGIRVVGDSDNTRTPGSPGFVTSINVTVSNNYIHDMLGFTHSDGIQLFNWPQGTKIIGNYITRVGQGIMTEEVQSAELSNNVIWNTSGYNVIFGHSNSSNWLINNNTIGGAGLGAFNMTATGYTLNENVFFNKVTIPNVTAYSGNRNLFYATNGAAPLRIAAGTGVGNHTSISTWQTATGSDANSQIGNPLFNNAPVVVSQFNAANLLLNTTTSLYLDSVTGFVAGDKIQINSDGVLRTLTAVDTVNKKITFDVALPMIPMTPYGMVENYKTSTNMAVDLRLSAGSPGKTMGATGGAIGSSINNTAYVLGDFNNDGIRDIPTVTSDVLAGLPSPNGWLPPSF